MTLTQAISFRRADASDLSAIVGVCGQALQWADGDANAEFFQWKHVANPFGPSPIWVAQVGAPVGGTVGSGVDGALGPSGLHIVGVRAMMRWQLQRPGHEPALMTRAVDTATLPAYQGQGIFSRLTTAAITELASEGASSVFNTPNDQSRPGYLKLGWELLGRVPVTVRPRSLGALAAMVRSKTPADKWGQPCHVGLAPAEALAQTDQIERALSDAVVPTAWTTPLSLDYLRWRTGFEPLGCRIQPLGRSLAEGFIVFRVRQRGVLRQLSLLHVVSPSKGQSVRRAISSLLGATGADVALASGGSLGLRAGMVMVPRIGPLMTWKTLASPWKPTLSELDLPLGAIEMF